jgi:hypothetical protein
MWIALRSDATKSVRTTRRHAMHDLSAVGVTAAIFRHTCDMALPTSQRITAQAANVR